MQHSVYWFDWCMHPLSRIKFSLMWIHFDWFIFCCFCSCVFCSERGLWWNVNHNKSQPFTHGPVSLCKYNSSLHFAFTSSLSLPRTFTNSIIWWAKLILNDTFSLLLFSVFFSPLFMINMKVASNGVPPSISKRVLLRVQCKLFIPYTQFARIHFGFLFT